MNISDNMIVKIIKELTACLPILNMFVISISEYAIEIVHYSEGM